MEMSYCVDKGIPHSEFLGWDPEDRAKLVAWMLEDADRCSMCGTAPWEWAENRFAYTAVDDFCQGCYQKAIFTEQQSQSLPGTNVKLVPTTPALLAQMQVKEKRRRKTLAEE